MAELALNGESGLYEFATEEMTGALEGTGFYHGVREVRRRGDTISINRPDLFLLNFYRAFVVGEDMGYLRKLEHVAELEGNRLTVTMKPSDWHHAEVRAVYEVSDPAAIDLHVTVRAMADFPYYNLYLSSYFNRPYDPFVYVHRAMEHESIKAPGFLHVEENDFVRGYYISFPRDLRAGMARYDGRWACQLNGPSVGITGPYLAAPLAFMFSKITETACVLMARPDECDSIHATYAPDEVWDGVSAHNAIYMTLVGKDLAEGEEWNGTVRMEVMKVGHGFRKILERYGEFTGEEL